MDDCELQVEIARLQEQVKAGDKALSLAETLKAAAEIAARAQAHSMWSALLAVVALLISLAALVKTMIH